MNELDRQLLLRAEAAERLVEMLTEQLRSAEQRDLAAQEQIRQLQAQVRHFTALVEGMQRQLEKVLREVAKVPKKKELDDQGAADAAMCTETTTSAETTTDEGAAPLDNDAATAGGGSPPLRPEGKGPSKPKKKPRRPAALPAHLPRHTIRLVVDSCGHCGDKDVVAVGEEVSERYDYIPAQIVVERIERPTFRCRACGGFTTAARSPAAVPNGSMTAAMLAHIAYSKCCLHLPLSRTAEDLERLGAVLPSATMSDAMGHVADLLEPVRDQIVEDLFASGLLHLDGTGVKVLTPGKKGSYRGQFAVLSNAEATAYFFSESKHGERMAELLRQGTDKAYHGYLIADAASNMDLLYEDGSVIECGCWYHARDKYEDALSGAPADVAAGLAWISALFQVEHEADDAGDTAEQRKARRQRDSQPVLDGLTAWMRAIQPRYTPDEELWKAVQYGWNHWKALTRFLEDGRIPLTNNQAERDLGPIGRGRKAYLFAGSADGGRRLATAYTVVGTCLRLGIDPRAYMTDVLPLLSTMPANRGRGQLAGLMPKAWRARQTEGPAPPSG